MNNQNYYQSYLKYKKKYLELKRLYKGGKPFTESQAIEFRDNIDQKVSENRKEPDTFEQARRKYFITLSPKIIEKYEEALKVIAEANALKMGSLKNGPPIPPDLPEEERRYSLAHGTSWVDPSKELYKNK